MNKAAKLLLPWLMLFSNIEYSYLLSVEYSCVNILNVSQILAKIIITQKHCTEKVLFFYC